jgi:hypothetical protein
VTGDTLYRRTQIAWPVVVPVALVSALLGWTFVRTEFAAGLGIALAVLLVSLLLFATLTVTVTNDGLVASFGIGPIRKRIDFSDVASFARVRNSWMNGWGIHAYPGGMLYNASGLSAVEFRLTSGQYVAIGTGEPEALAAVLRQVIGKPESLSHEPPAQRSSRAPVVAAVIGIAALALVGATVYLGLQPPVVRLTDNAIEVRGGMYSNTVAYSAMNSATLENTIPRVGLKTNGFAVSNTLRGSFNVDGWGNGRLYINGDAPPFVVIRAASGFVVVNFRDPNQTRALYADLAAHLNRSSR